LADLYSSELSAIVDQLLPLRTSTCQSRLSDPWFDNDCRDAKRQCRCLERQARWTSWKSELRAYRHLIGHKREAFWKSLITKQQSRLRQMWQSIDRLLGRGRPQGSDDISAGDFHSFFDKKVSDIRASTSDIAALSFASTDCAFSGFQPSHKMTSPQLCIPCRTNSATPTQSRRGCSRNVRLN